MRKILGAATLAAFVGAAGLASAADLNAGGGLKDSYVAAPLWAGWYIGVNGGYGWGATGDLNAKVHEVYCEDYEEDPCWYSRGKKAASLTSEGGFGGGQIGYNWQRERLVFGLEADIQGAGISGSANARAFADDVYLDGRAQSSIDWFGTVRGRLGLTFPDAAGLIYVTGGFAYGGVQHKVSASLFDSNYGDFLDHKSASNDRIEAGYVLGAGYERFITQNLSAKIEYQYIDLGSDKLKTERARGGECYDYYYGCYAGYEARGKASATFFDNFSTVRAGLNYHLNPAYEPLK